MRFSLFCYSFVDLNLADSRSELNADALIHVANRCNEKRVKKASHKRSSTEKNDTVAAAIEFGARQ